jgi:hypothetical protein
LPARGIVLVAQSGLLEQGTRLCEVVRFRLRDTPRLHTSHSLVIQSQTYNQGYPDIDTVTRNVHAHLKREAVVFVDVEASPEVLSSSFYVPMMRLAGRARLPYLEIFRCGLHRLLEVNASGGDVAIPRL